MVTPFFSSDPDRDGDHFEMDASEDYPGELLFSVYKSGTGTWGVAYVTRTEVIALRDVLSDWLDGTHGLATAPPAPPAYVTEDRVRQLIAEAILPLHKSPQAAEPDPEPRDVGHPEPEVMCKRTQPTNFHAATRCTFCGFLWADHPTVGERLSQMMDTVRAAMNPVRQLVGCECGHRWSLHGGASCHGQIADGRTCECTRSAPQVYSPQTAECGVCGHLWSDTHGYSGDPCVPPKVQP